MPPLSQIHLSCYFGDAFSPFRCSSTPASPCLKESLYLSSLSFSSADVMKRLGQGPQPQPQQPQVHPAGCRIVLGLDST
jgi:hypothetical protein